MSAKDQLTVRHCLRRRRFKYSTTQMKWFPVLITLIPSNDDYSVFRLIFYVRHIEMILASLHSNIIRMRPGSRYF